MFVWKLQIVMRVVCQFALSWYTFKFYELPELASTIAELFRRHLQVQQPAT